MTARQRASASAPPEPPPKVASDRTWLLGAEREYPFELPELRELTRWYLFSLAALAAAATLAAVTYATSRSPKLAACIFWPGLLFGALVATPLANGHGRPFVFTWPLALLAVHQLTLATISGSRRSERASSADWAAFAAVTCLVLTCLLYFQTTRQLRLAPAWYFLLTLPASWPLALPAANRLSRQKGLPGHLLWLTAVFSLYFWASSGIMLWRAMQ